MASKEESEDFMSIFPVLVSDFVHLSSNDFADITELSKHIKTALLYNVSTEKKIRGLGLVSAYKMVESPENLNSTNIRLANILGWCVEMLQSVSLMCKDIIEQSEIRWGTLCWYKNQNVGNLAISDAVLIENGVFAILKKYFSNHPSYVRILEVFHDVTLKTSMGQCLDGMCMKDDKPNFDYFMMNKYNSIVEYKSSYYTFYLPVALAMILTNNHDEELHSQAKDILLEMGQFFQIQDDFLNCFGKEEVANKRGSDIVEGKCTWLAVVALQKVSPKQKDVLKEHYGKPNDGSEQIVRNLYDELGLPRAYKVYEEERLDLIRTHIQQISEGIPHALFLKFMEMFFSREC